MVKSNLLLAELNDAFIVAAYAYKDIEFKNINNKNYYIIGNDYENKIGIEEETLKVYIISNDTCIIYK